MALAIHVTGAPRHGKATGLRVAISGWDISTAPTLWLGSTPTDATPSTSAGFTSGGLGLRPLGDIDQISAATKDDGLVATLRFVYFVGPFQADDHYLWACLGADDGGTLAASSKVPIRT